MEDNDQIILVNTNSEVADAESSSSVELKVQLSEQDENEQIINLEEDLAACFLDRMAIIL